MESKEDGDANEDRPSSPIWVLQHLSGEAFRAAGEVIQSVYPGNLSVRPTAPPGHRRVQSEVPGIGHRRSNSFQRLKSHVQKAWKWGSNYREEGRRSNFNPEVMANQKRQWYRLHSQVTDHTNYKEPTSLFEHFIVAGLQPDANLQAVENAFAKRKKWETEMENSDVLDFKMLHLQKPGFPVMEPQILFKYPPAKKLAMRYKDLAAFCFPGGVTAHVLERSPSLSDLNELIYGQEHLARDDLSFIFSLKVADNATLYGVCLHVMEIVQRPPDIILGAASPFSHSSRGCNRFLVSAPRCYCILTKVPFFELHYEMLNSIISQQRLNRITEFVSEICLYDYVPTTPTSNDQTHDKVESLERNPFNDWMTSAIPVDSAVAFTAAAAGMKSEDRTPRSSLRAMEANSPESFSASESSEFSHSRELDRDGRRNLQYFDDSSDASETRSDTFERMCGSCDRFSPDVKPFSRFHTIERPASFESLFSPARSMTSEDDDDECFSNFEKDLGDELIMEWAKEIKNDVLQIICGYHSQPLPSRGNELVFQPLEHLQLIEYHRPSVSALGFHEKIANLSESSKVKFKLAAAEEARALSIWTTATICRVLSVENVLAMITGVLLEKQVVIVCPNLGVLSATVLSLIPMILPFQWQSLLLPVLPRRMLEFLDAPVPFIVGLLNKPNDLKMKSSNLVHVNVLKDQVKASGLPSLPRYKELVSALAPIHARLSFESSLAKRHPVHKCSETQVEAAGQFLKVMRSYLESLCSDQILRLHSITSVQSNNDRVSLLLKDSFIDSFPSRDQPFMKLFVDTQMFNVLSDSRLSRFENGYS